MAVAWNGRLFQRAHANRFASVKHHQAQRQAAACSECSQVGMHIDVFTQQSQTCQL